MNRGQSVFAQLLGFVPFSHFEHLVDRFSSNHGIKHFSAWNHFLCIAYSQLTRREGLRDLVACLNSQRTKLYHIGIRGKISRSTLADANERRDWRVFEALGHRLIAIAVELHQGEDIGLGFKEPLYALDSTTIDLCLTLFPWADFRSTKAAVKAHTIVDLRGSIPVFVHITTGKVHDVNVLDQILAEGEAANPRAPPSGKRGRTRQSKALNLIDRLALHADDVWRFMTDHNVPFSNYGQIPRLPHQSLRPAGSHHRRDLSKAVAGRDLFQVDQTESLDQAFLRQLHQRGQVRSNLGESPSIAGGLPL